MDFLQKPTYDELEKCNGLDTANRAFIDTGVMNFGIDAIEVLMRASRVSLADGKIVVGKDSLCEDLINVREAIPRIGANIQLDIYKEIPFAMLGKLSTDDGLNGLVICLSLIRLIRYHNPLTAFSTARFIWNS